MGLANTNPVPVVVSAVMRSNSTLMDVVYRVNDPDDSTVKVRALAFIDGSRSFTRILRPSAFVEGTGTNLGDAIAANVNHTLTWDVAADWDIDLGQAKFEILCLDNRGLLQFDWISIPAASGQPALTISQDTPAANKVLDALFWLYASGDAGMSTNYGALFGNTNSGVFNGLPLASGGAPLPYGAAYVFKQMNLDPAAAGEVDYAQATARAELLNATNWHAVNRPFSGVTRVVGWGQNSYGQLNFNPIGATEVKAIATGMGHGLALMKDGMVLGWGLNYDGQATAPAGLSGVTAIAAGTYFSMALRSNGTVVAWGDNRAGQTNVPPGLSGVTAIAGGLNHCVALKDDGTVIAWGRNYVGETNVPPGLSSVKAISAGTAHNLALKSDGTVVAWGYNVNGQTNVPPGLSNVIAIAAGDAHNVALLSNGTVYAWGNNTFGQTMVPAGLTWVTAIAAGEHHSLALESDGTVVAWGYNNFGQTNVPSGLSGVTNIAAGYEHSLALMPKAL